MMTKDSETTVLKAVKKLLKWLAAALIVIFILASLIGLGTYAFYEIKDRPKIETELKRVVIGEKLRDVMFKSDGYILEKPIKNENGTLPSTDEVSYANKNSRLYVTFKSDTVESVHYDCTQEYEYTSVSKIFCGDSSEQIKKRFGENIRVLCHMDKEVRNQLRVYDAVEYGIRYQLYYNKVVGFLIFRPEKLASLIGVNWSECD